MAVDVKGDGIAVGVDRGNVRVIGALVIVALGGVSPGLTVLRECERERGAGIPARSGCN